MTLNEGHIGSYVEYHGLGGEIERGRIKSRNNKFIFVVYKCNNEWERFSDYNGVATDPKDLVLVE